MHIQDGADLLDNNSAQAVTDKDDGTGFLSGLGLVLVSIMTLGKERDHITSFRSPRSLERSVRRFSAWPKMLAWLAPENLTTLES